MNPTSLDQFYQDLTALTESEPTTLLPPGIQQEIGHFNVFDVAELMKHLRERPAMSYDRRMYYKSA